MLKLHTHVHVCVHLTAVATSTVDPVLTRSLFETSAFIVVPALIWTLSEKITQLQSTHERTCMYNGTCVHVYSQYKQLQILSFSNDCNF